MDLVTLILFVVGFMILVKGADLLVDGGSSIGKRFGISELIIGLTIVSFGTSLPELLVNIYASFDGSADIAIGNAVGSSIFNILFILGITAVIMPITAGGISYIDLGMMVITAVILLPMSKGGLRINRVEGFILLAGYCVYIYFLLPN